MPRGFGSGVYHSNRKPTRADAYTESLPSSSWASSPGGLREQLSGTFSVCVTSSPHDTVLRPQPCCWVTRDYATTPRTATLTSLGTLKVPSVRGCVSVNFDVCLIFSCAMGSDFVWSVMLGYGHPNAGDRKARCSCGRGQQWAFSGRSQAFLLCPPPPMSFPLSVSKPL